MRNKKSPSVIAIAGVSGGGKTIIANRLSDRLPNSSVLFFDNYDFEGPNDMIGWVDRGSIYEEWNLSPLIIDLEGLLQDNFDYIVLDYPFSYNHSQLRSYIDFTVFIDTPLDIAMARRILRDFHNSSTEIIMKEMDNYLLQGRRGYLEMLKTIKPNSELIVDGSQAVATLVEEIYHKTIKRKI
jgi:uridine kinase